MKKIKCKRCKEPRSEWDLLEGYCLLCAGRVIQLATQYVVQKDPKVWKELKRAVG